jgi:two-component system, cell cycle sensor histidine kinase and response regulator CckA
VFLGVAVTVILARYTNPLAWLGLAFGASTLIFYVTQTAVIVRRQRIRADELSVRTMHAEKMEAIGKLAGGVAHDSNNLLSVILGDLDLTIEIKDDDTRQQLLHDARSATLRGASVVRQLLTYARQTESTPQVTDAAVLLGSVETMCRTLIPATVTLTIATPQLPMSVAVDDALFITAILNFIKNGIDAIEGAGRIDLTVKPLKLTKPKLSSAGQTMSAGNYLAFTVTDSGPGIPADTLSRVFDPFFTTKPVGKGSGLGLSMVAGFAVQSGGGTEIKSSEGGTGVSLQLPDVASFPRGTLDLTKKDAAN